MEIENTIFVNLEEIKRNQIKFDEWLKNEIKKYVKENWDKL